MESAKRKLLVEQINAAPEPLRSYVRDLETHDSSAHLIQENYALKEQNSQLLVKLTAES